MRLETVRDAFSLERDVHRQLVPALMRDLTGRCDDLVREHLLPLVGHHGNIPYCALENDHHAHDAAVFDLFLGSYGNPAADRDLIALQWEIHMLSLGPWDAKSSERDRAVAVERLMPFATRMGAPGGQSSRALATRWLEDQASYYVEYVAHRAMIEHSDVAARLNRSGIAHRFEPGRNFVRVIIPDAEAADVVRNAF